MAKNTQPIIEHTFNTVTRGKCICGADISAGHDENGVPGVVHGYPTCKLFDDTEDPTEFLATINRYRSFN